MKTLTNRERKLAFLTLLIVILAFILNFLVIPLKNSWDKINYEIELKELTLEKYNDLANRKQKNNEYLDTKKYKNDIDVLNELFSLVDKMSNKSSINLLSIRPQAKEKKDNITKYRMEVSLEGNFKNILKFIENITQTNCNFLVEELQVNKSSQTGVLSARLLISKFAIL